LRFKTSDGRRQPFRLQTVEGPFGPAVGGFYIYIWPPLLIKPYNRALGARENMPTRLRLMEMHPFCLRHLHLKVKRLTMICVSLSLLQIMFAVHPGGGGLLSTQRLPPHNKLIA
jgi:hypothetical protein